MRITKDMVQARAGVDIDAINYANNGSKIFLLWPNQI